MGETAPKYGANPPYMQASNGYNPVQYTNDSQQMQYMGQVQQGMTAGEVAMAKLDNTISSMEDQQMTADPRYASMLYLKQKMSGK